MDNYFPTVNLPTSSYSLPSANSVIDPYQIARGQQHVDPQLFQLYLTSSMSNLDSILFGDNNNNNQEDSLFGSANPLASYPYANTQTAQSSSIFPSSYSMFEQMINRAGLIGKTVDARDPNSSGIMSGKVTGVTTESGQLQIIVNGTTIPPENLVSIKE